MKYKILYIVSLITLLMMFGLNGVVADDLAPSKAEQIFQNDLESFASFIAKNGDKKIGEKTKNRLIQDVIDLYPEKKMFVDQLQAIDVSDKNSAGTIMMIRSEAYWYGVGKKKEALKEQYLQEAERHGIREI